MERGDAHEQAGAERALRWFGGRHAAADPRVELLAESSARGDREAFGELYSLLADDVYRFALASLGSPAAAEDAVAEVFLEAWRSARSFNKRNGSYRAWLFSIARAEVRDQSDRLWDQPAQIDQHLAESLAGSGDGDPATVEAAAVAGALAGLHEQERTALILRYYCDATYHEVGVAIGKHEAAARRIVLRALTNLRKALDDVRS